MAEVTRTNLLELVNSKTEEEIGWYLEDTPVKSFIKDVRELAKQNSDKALIQKTITDLQKLL